MHLEAIETLIEIERTCDTTRLIYGDVSYWPLCRQKIWAQLMQRLALLRQTEGAALGPKPLPPVHAAPGDVTAFAMGDPQLGLLHFDHAAAEQARELGALAPEALFLIRPEEYFDTINGARYAKTVDSVFGRATVGHRAGKIELLSAESAAFPRTLPPMFLSLPHASRGVTFDPPHALRGFEEIAPALARAGIALTAETLSADLGKIFYFARIFEKVLASLRPSVVFQSVYYWPVGMAWVLAARRLGILSADLQHGRLGPHEGHYTHLTAAPPGGYDLVPDVVWCWGAQTKHDIDHAKNPACRRHGGLIGGNAWLARWRYGVEPTPTADTAKLDAICAGRKVMLVSLQPYDAPLFSEIIDAMRAGPPEWLWLLRLHPLRRHTAPALRTMLTQLGITNVELDLATDLPLFSILRRTDHHVTMSSSVAVEAAAFDIHTSIACVDGRRIFAPQIARGIFRYTPTGADIVAHAREQVQSPRRPIDDDFIDMRREIADEALDAILGPPTRGSPGPH